MENKDNNSVISVLPVSGNVLESFSGTMTQTLGIIRQNVTGVSNNINLLVQSANTMGSTAAIISGKISYMENSIASLFGQLNIVFSSSLLEVYKLLNSSIGGLMAFVGNAIASGCSFLASVMREIALALADIIAAANEYEPAPSFKDTLTDNVSMATSVGGLALSAGLAATGVGLPAAAAVLAGTALVSWIESSNNTKAYEEKEAKRTGIIADGKDRLNNLPSAPLAIAMPPTAPFLAGPVQGGTPGESPCAGVFADVCKCLSSFVEALKNLVAEIVVCVAELTAPKNEGEQDGSGSSFIDMLGKNFSFVSEISGTLDSLSSLMTVLTDIGGVQGMIIGIVAILVITLIEYIVKNWDQILLSVKTFFNKIKEALFNAWNWISQTVKNLFMNFLNIYIGFWVWIFQTGKKIFSTIGEFFVNIWNWIVQSSKNIFNNLIQFLVDTWNNVIESASTFFKNIKIILSNVWEAIQQTIKDIFLGAWDSIKSFFENLFDKIKALFAKLMPKFWDKSEEEAKEKKERKENNELSTSQNISNISLRDGNRQSPLSLTPSAGINPKGKPILTGRSGQNIVLNIGKVFEKIEVSKENFDNKIMDAGSLFAQGVVKAAMDFQELQTT